MNYKHILVTTVVGINKETELIRFVNEIEYLVDDIKNGFKLTKHNIDFETTPYHNLFHLLRFWKEGNINQKSIKKVLELESKSNNAGEFLKTLEDVRKEEPLFDIEFKLLIAGFSFKPYMKCFTEIRDNQKIHRGHVGDFGEYGISLSKEWGVLNQAAPVLYLEDGNELSKRIGLILSMLKTSAKGIEHNKASLDLLSLVEHNHHSHEYEWRILGPTNFLDTPKEPPRVSFKLSDINKVYVRQLSEIPIIKHALIELKKKKEKWRYWTIT